MAEMPISNIRRELAVVELTGGFACFRGYILKLRLMALNRDRSDFQKFHIIPGTFITYIYTDITEMFGIALT